MYEKLVLIHNRLFFLDKNKSLKSSKTINTRDDQNFVGLNSLLLYTSRSS